MVTARFVRSAHSRRDLLEDGTAEFAFVGRSNVGKSSLLNRLLGRKGLARTSSTPGRTRAVNYFQIDESFYFVDLPGYGYARAGKSDRQQWAVLVEDYFQLAGHRVCAIQLVDAKVGATPLDVEARVYLRHVAGEALVVATKIDRVPRGRRMAALNGVGRELELPAGERVIPFSARTGEGVKELWSEIRARTEQDGQRWT